MSDALTSGMLRRIFSIEENRFAEFSKGFETASPKSAQDLGNVWRMKNSKIALDKWKNIT